MTNVAYHLPNDLDTPARVGKQSVLVEPVAKPAVAFTPIAMLVPDKSVHPVAAARNGFKAIARLLVFSVVLAGSPALATQVGRYDARCHSCEQQAATCRHSTFGTSENCVPQGYGPNPTHNDWPARMILD